MSSKLSFSIENILSDDFGKKAVSASSQPPRPLSYLECQIQQYIARISPSGDQKPNCSYIALIALAIMSSKQNMLVLSDIYDYISSNFEFYRKRTDQSWRNSIRHNLSIHEFFIKAERSSDGKGFYWAIHPANLEDFLNLDFSRRQANALVKDYTLRQAAIRQTETMFLQAAQMAYSGMY